MFYVNRDTEITEALLDKMLNKFNINVQPKIQKYKNYYDGIQAIDNKNYTDTTKKCNKAVTNYCMNITENYNGYIATPGYITYSSYNDITDIMEILKYNDYQAEDSEFLQNALIYGTAAELMYVDSESHVRFKLINPTMCFGIFDDSLSNDLLYFVRWYKKNEWDDSDAYCLDLYDDLSIKHYEMNGLNSPRFISEEPHYFNQVPANIFYLQDEKSIFDCIMSLQDAYNEELTNEIDDYSSFCDAYMILTGARITPEDAQKMKEKRVLSLPEGATAAWLTKTNNDGQVENILKRLHESIYRIAQCPDFSNINFTNGVSSGIALRFRLCNMENRAAKIAAEMKKALQRRIEIICGFTTLLMGEEVFRDIKIDFKRNVPDDITTTVNLINSLKGTISDETLIAQLPFVTDVEAELDAVNKQKQANIALYSFTANNIDNEEDNEE